MSDFLETIRVKEHNLLSKDQAGVIADEILGQARQARHDKHRMAPSSVAIVYRCRALLALPGWMQMEVVRQATQAVARSPVFFSMSLASALAFVMLFMHKPESPIRAGLVGLSIMVFGLFPMLLRVLLVRRHVRIVAGELQAWAPFPDAQ